MSATPLRVLLIEDNPGDARLILEMVAEQSDVPCDLQVADRLSSGLERLSRGEFDAVLLDLSLPDSDGLNTIAQVKEQAPGIPIVVLTGFADEEMAASAVRSGAQDYLVKGRVDGSLLRRSLRYAIERQRGEQALRESERKYHALFEESRDAIYVATSDGRIADVNQAWLELFGYSREEVEEGLNAADAHVDLADRDRFQQEIERTGAVTDFEVKLRKKDGTEMDCLLTAGLHRTKGGGVGYQGIIRDVTAHKRLERQFRLSQRLEAIGQLAGGVAHDFNNLLTVIMGSSELLMSDLGTDHPGRHEVEEIKRAAGRAADLTRQLLAFSRRQVLKPRVLDLNRVVGDLEKMLRRVIGEDITLVTGRGPELGRVKADPGQIEQVIMNLAVNARDAMPEGGTLTVETMNAELDEEYACQHVPAQPGSYVMLAVSDTGTGMDKDIQTHIFEPFFTTKEHGGGTGLGLATVYGIVKQSGGYIWVYSEPGQGTTFKIYLPRVDAPVESPEPGRLLTKPAPGSETILVVEDEPAVRTLFCEFLRRYGYTVLEASGAADALKICERHPGPIELVVTDVVMPSMGGRELAERLAASRPEMKLLYVSGYTDRAIVHRMLQPSSAFLQKPFGPDVLARKVREVLDMPVTEAR